MMDYVSTKKIINTLDGKIWTSLLKDRRLAKGYSTDDLAVATGLTVAEIDEAEAGGMVSPHHLDRIQHVLR